MSGAVKLATDVLEACAAPNDEVAVQGALQELLTAELPPDLIHDKPWEIIVQAGFRSVKALRSLQEKHLRELQFNMGDAATIMDTLQPREVRVDPGVVAQNGGSLPIVNAIPAKVGVLTTPSL